MNRKIADLEEQHYEANNSVTKALRLKQERE